MHSIKHYLANCLLPKKLWSIVAAFNCCSRIIYHGPVADVQVHFESVGFTLPPRMDLPSWLVEITTPAGELWATQGPCCQHPTVTVGRVGHMRLHLICKVPL